jgi:ABC-2 type transport system ATP-binding protein
MRAYVPAMTAIQVQGLRKSYGDTEAVRGVDLEVRTGEILALLGPNGAGKTTTVEILEGFHQATAGEVRVLGEDPWGGDRALRDRIGIVLQESQPEINLTVRECLELYAGYYTAPRDVEETIGLAGLGEQADQQTTRLSGGQWRRLDVALALIGDPELIFLDEPTTGFDPAARRTAWRTIRTLADLGKTVLLTTHYLDEAQALCDRVAIVKDGRVIATGAPAELDSGAARYRVAWRDRDGELHGRETADPTALLHQLTSEALAHGEQLRDLSVTRPTLEEVYLELVEADG